MKNLRPPFSANISRLNAVAVAFLTASPLASAALAVNWGGTNYVSAARDFASAGGFSGGEPIQINPLSPNYPIGAVNSANFYGKVETFSGTSTAVSSVNHAATGDLISMKSADSLNNTGYLILWEQADFLNGLNTGNVGFDATTTITTTVTTYSAQSTTDSGRLVVRLGSSYYVSERIFGAPSTTFTPTPTELTWFAYNPTTSINVDAASLVAASIVADGSIANVTEVGFYFESINTNNAARIQNFDVNLVAIPEPATVSLLGLLAPLALSRRRR